MGAREIWQRGKINFFRKKPYWVAAVWARACKFPWLLGVLLKIFKDVK